MITFVGGGYVPSTQRGTERDGLMHGSDWLPTIIGLATSSSSSSRSPSKTKSIMASEPVNIETISNDLQDRLYIPVAKRVALKIENNTDNYSKYLVRESFDGIDLSQWLLYGDSNDNPRTSLGLSVNSLYPLNNSVSIVFESELTDHRYKFIYLTEAKTHSSEYCAFCHNYGSNIEERCEINDPISDVEMLFDLTIDGNETTNLITDSLRNLIMSNKSLSMNENMNKNKNMNKNMNVNKFGSKAIHRNSGKYTKHSEVNYLSDYKKNANNGLVDLLLAEAEAIIYEYQENALYNEYLMCQAINFNQANPALFGSAWSPFFSWQEYQSTFQEICGNYINDVLLEMYLSDYGDYLHHV